MATAPQVFGAELLGKRYGDRNVVDGVSLSVSPGEIVGLLGPNGAGKTTTFSMMLGIERVDTGRVYLDDADLTPMPMYRRARMGVGFLPQEASIFRKLTTADNLMVVLERSRTVPRKLRRERVQRALKEFNIEHIANTYSYQLSGGERRRLEICRALIAEPAFLLLDEPFAGIDPIAVEDLQGIIASVRDRGIGVIITDHNVRETLRICDRAYLLNQGKVLIEGSPETISRDETARQVYLGEGFEL